MTALQMAQAALDEAEAPVTLTAEEPLMKGTLLILFPGVLPDGDTGNARFVQGLLGLEYLGFSRQSKIDETYENTRGRVS